MFKKVGVFLSLLVGLGILLSANYFLVNRLASRLPLGIPEFFNLAQEPIPPNSASRQLWWVKAYICIGLSDAQLDTWKARGVGGFVCQHNWLRQMGGTQDFTGDPNHTLTGSQYDLQRSFKNSKIVDRAKARGMKMYLSFYAVNYNNCVTPYAEWFDDAGWSNTVLPQIRNMAGAVKILGMSGLNIDQELYQVSGNCKGVRPSWGNSGTVPAGGNIAAKVKQRGQEMMSSMVQAFPGIEVMFYDNPFPESWEQVVQKVVNNYDLDTQPRTVRKMNFWDGMTSAQGYSAIRYQDAIFYKTNHVSNATWDNALQYNANRLYAYLSRNFSNWDYASSRFSVTPFSWIDDDCRLEGSWARNRTVPEVDAQLLAFNKWGMDGQFSIYTYGNNFTHNNYADYYSDSPEICSKNDPDYPNRRPYNYLPGIKAASVAKVADSEYPTLTVTTPSSDTVNSTQSTLALSGYAKDNMAIRYVKWANDRGGSGTAKMTWKIHSGDYRTGYNWQMDWTIDSVPLSTGKNVITLTVQDIKGLQTKKIITVNPGLGGGPSITSPPPSVTPTKTPTPTATKTPTPIPTKTPTPTNAPNATATPTAIPNATSAPEPTLGCATKPQGDADCDGVTTLTDFEAWRKEFMGEAGTKNADFTGDGMVTLADFETWRKNFL